MPNTLEQEYRAAQEHCVLMEWATWGVVRVEGSDRVAFLHSLLSNDITSLIPGRSCEAALLTPTGKLLAHLAVIADAEAHWLLTDRPRIETVLTTLNRYLIMEQVTMTDVSRSYAIVGLHGPQAAVVVGVVSQKITVRQVNYSLVTKDDRLLIVPTEEVARIRDRLIAAGAVPIGWEAFNVLRIEAGIPWYGIDMDESNLLPETGLEERLVSYTKGCYVGQEVVARLQTYGSVSQKLMRLACDGTVVPGRGDEIRKGDQPVGQITSACFSPRLKRPLALGYLKRPHYQAETPVTIVCHGRPVSAAVRPRNI
jgi:folate-binding protein YgfZ